MKFILMDIEGTTTSIDFVHKTLFPYAKKHMETFLLENQNEQIDSLLLDVINTASEEGSSLEKDQCSKVLLEWIDQDRKHPALKSLQGLIWEKGYKDGSLKGHLYPEVSAKFEEWSNRGYLLGIYSSGSVKAQKLLFGHSEDGDLTTYLRFYFDTQVGHKREDDSYKEITKGLGGVAENILFLSDVVEELDAAKKVGMKTCQLCRQDDMKTGEHPIAKDFHEVEQFLEE